MPQAKSLPLFKNSIAFSGHFDYLMGVLFPRHIFISGDIFERWIDGRSPFACPMSESLLTFRIENVQENNEDVLVMMECQHRTAW